jgi:hypothetical protein
MPRDRLYTIVLDHKGARTSDKLQGIRSLQL